MRYPLPESKDLELKRGMGDPAPHRFGRLKTFS